MKITEFIRKELTGWKKPEIIGLVFVLSLIIINALVVKDSIISVISAICGILYTIIAGKGKISCYLFGLAGSGFYCRLSFQSALWGNLILYACYYIPMQIIGFFKWKKHLQSATNEIIKTQLSKRDRITFSLITICACLAVILTLKQLNDTNPIFDGITSIVSIAGMYLTVRRCIEQWIAWMIVNFLSALMWINIIFQGEKAYATVIMWITYFILSVYFYTQWKQQLKNKI